jgi:cell wall-associated NlpC family hydrolase
MRKTVYFILIVLVLDLVCYKRAKRWYNINKEFKEAWLDEKYLKTLPLGRKNIILKAKKYIGTPYINGGETPDGFDCSGFTKFVFSAYKIKIPRNSYEQSKLGKKIGLKEALPGDLIFFGKKFNKGYKTSHVGIVYKKFNGKVTIIHAASQGIVIDQTGKPAWEGYWKKRYLFVKRIL